MASTPSPSETNAARIRQPKLPSEYSLIVFRAGFKSRRRPCRAKIATTNTESPVTLRNSVRWNPWIFRRDWGLPDHRPTLSRLGGKTPGPARTFLAPTRQARVAPTLRVALDPLSEPGFTDDRGRFSRQHHQHAKGLIPLLGTRATEPGRCLDAAQPAGVHSIPSGRGACWR